MLNRFPRTKTLASAAGVPLSGTASQADAEGRLFFQGQAFGGVAERPIAPVLKAFSAILPISCKSRQT